MRQAQFNLAVDVLWVILALSVAYVCLQFNARPGAEISGTDLMRTFLFLIFIAVAVGFIKQVVVDFAKLLRESADGHHHLG